MAKVILSSRAKLGQLQKLMNDTWSVKLYIIWDRFTNPKQNTDYDLTLGQHWEKKNRSGAIENFLLSDEAKGLFKPKPPKIRDVKVNDDTTIGEIYSQYKSMGFNAQIFDENNKPIDSNCKLKDVYAKEEVEVVEEEIEEVVEETDWINDLLELATMDIELELYDEAKESLQLVFDEGTDEQKEKAQKLLDEIEAVSENDLSSDIGDGKAGDKGTGDKTSSFNMEPESKNLLTPYVLEEKYFIKSNSSDKNIPMNFVLTSVSLPNDKIIEILRVNNLELNHLNACQFLGLKPTVDIGINGFFSRFRLCGDALITMKEMGYSLTNANENKRIKKEDREKIQNRYGILKKEKPELFMVS